MAFTLNPNSRLDQSGILPLWLPQGGEVGLNAIFGAWNSGCYRMDEDEFLSARAGGDGDWAGNQVVGFSFGHDRWILRFDYSRNYEPANSGNPSPNPYRDGTPASVHTYGATVWMPNKKRIWSGGGIIWKGIGSTPKVWWFDPSVPNGQWDAKITRPGGYTCSSVWHELTQTVLAWTSAGLYRYRADPDTYEKVRSESLGGDASSDLALDADRNILYRFLKKPVGGPFKVLRLDLTSNTQTEIDTIGDTDAERTNGAGLVYNQGALWTLGTKLYRLDLDHRDALGRAVWGSAAVPAGCEALLNGTWGRLFLHPTRGLVHVNAMGVWEDAEMAPTFRGPRAFTVAVT